MKLHIASIAALTLGFATILKADLATDTTDRFTSGALDQRIEELGTNAANGEKVPAWKKTQKAGIKRHCMATLRARGAEDLSPCDR